MLKRLKTAIFFVIIMLVAILLNQYGFILAFGAICVMSLWEFHCLLYHDLTGRKRSKRIIANVILGSIPYFAVGLYYLGSPFFDTGRLFALGILLFLSISVYYIIELASRLEKPFIIVSYALSGIFYVTVPCIMVIAVGFYSGVYDYTPVLGLLILTWLNDTGAFVVGSVIGKHQLFPRISPKKTWEGFWGGSVITLIVSYPVSMLFPVFSFTDWLILSVIVIIFGTLGDLIESMLKRSLAVKDSGSILPGHGGFLDRFDSFLFMLPFASFYILFIKS